MDRLLQLVVHLQDLGDEAGEEVAEGVFVALVWQDDQVEEVRLKLRQVESSLELLGRGILGVKGVLLLFVMREDRLVEIGRNGFWGAYFLKLDLALALLDVVLKAADLLLEPLIRIRQRRLSARPLRWLGSLPVPAAGTARPSSCGWQRSRTGIEGLRPLLLLAPRCLALLPLILTKVLEHLRRPALDDRSPRRMRLLRQSLPPEVAARRGPLAVVLLRIVIAPVLGWLLFGGAWLPLSLRPTHRLRFLAPHIAFGGKIAVIKGSLSSWRCPRRGAKPGLCAGLGERLLLWIRLSLRRPSFGILVLHSAIKPRWHSRVRASMTGYNN